jgi:hypothetical protein
MLILGKAVLGFGIFSVFGAAVHNHSQAGLRFADVSPVAVQQSAPAINQAGFLIAVPAAELSRGYWGNPATSPLQGISLRKVQTSGPIRQASVGWQFEIREVATESIQIAAHLSTDGYN